MSAFKYRFWRFGIASPRVFIYGITGWRHLFGRVWWRL
jgi:hypothetical protein